MASGWIDEISARYSILHSLSVSELEDSLEWNKCYAKVMQAQTAEQLSNLQKEPTQ